MLSVTISSMFYADLMNKTRELKTGVDERGAKIFTEFFETGMWEVFHDSARDLYMHGHSEKGKKCIERANEIWSIASGEACRITRSAEHGNPRRLQSPILAACKQWLETHSKLKSENFVLETEAVIEEHISNILRRIKADKAILYEMAKEIKTLRADVDRIIPITHALIGLRDVFDKSSANVSTCRSTS